MSAQYQVDGQVAVITINNPPVNGMGHATRSAMVECLQRAYLDDAVQAIILTGAGPLFSGGADIKEFNSIQALAEPSLHTLISTVEQASKPVIAALHGTCMGGGLELALGCHYRLAEKGTQIALPEVKLGLLPGAGGTQRLPRMVGLEIALEMIVAGEAVSAEKLAATSLLDAVVDADVLGAAKEFAAKVAGVRPIPKVRDKQISHPDASAFFAAARAKVTKMAGPFPAPLRCVDAIEAALGSDLDAGLAYEKSLFLELVMTPESKALRHAFFGERLASKIADVPADTPQRAIKSAAVIGAGTMGGGIAMNFANAGIPVMMLEMKQEALDKGLATIHKNYENSAKKGKLSPEKMAQRIGLIKGTLNYADLAQADIVIEAVFEDMAVKETVFKQLDAVMKPGAILASNTSTLDVDKIASFTQRPQDVIGTHFFSPANVMKLLEIVRGAKTGKDVLATTMSLAKKIRKTGVVSGVCDGFIGNRMIEQYARQAGFLLDEGCLPAQVDAAVEKFGFAMGPFRMGDLAGNDVGWYIRKRRYLEYPDMKYSQTADLLCEMGRFGQKTGAGWYDYRPGERAALPSSVVDSMIIEHSAKLGIARREISDEEIVERLVYSLVNEAAYILQEGIAQRASDVDMVYLTGYGFPLHRGGPMLYADTVGLPKVVAAIEKFAAGYQGEAWQLAPMLKELAAQGKGFCG